MRSGVRSDPASWKDPRHREGIAAEHAAMAFLASRGWRIVAHRFRVARHEVDIVARRGKLVAFVEVKRRSGQEFGSPFEALRGRQRRDLVRAARAWMDRYGQPGEVYRFDVIGVVGERLEHLEDAFRPGWR